MYRLGTEVDIQIRVIIELDFEYRSEEPINTNGGVRDANETNEYAWNRRGGYTTRDGFLDCLTGLCYCSFALQWSLGIRKGYLKDA
jgi:hypothetical protein